MAQKGKNRISVKEMQEVWTIWCTKYRGEVAQERMVSCYRSKMGKNRPDSNSGAKMSH